MAKYRLVVTMDREPEIRERTNYRKARKEIVSLLQKGENGWNVRVTGGDKTEFFERRGPGIVYQDGKIAREELTRDEVDQLVGVGEWQEE